MKIGVFGGSFNPIHNGHIRALDGFIQTIGIDKTFVIPSFLPPHKAMPELWASFEDRLKMVRLAIGGKSNVTVTDIEKSIFQETGEKGYTKNTIERLKRELDGDYYLFVGTDMFISLDCWYEFRWLFDNLTVAVMSRDGEKGVIEEKKRIYEEKYNASILVIDIPFIEVSSTEVRNTLVQGADSNAIPKMVADYIKRNNLYKKKKTRDELIELLKGALNESRVLHTLAVEKEALYLASHLCPYFNEEISRAALLHDITKYWSFDEHIAFAKRLGCELDENDLKAPHTLHAKTGAILAKELGESCSNVIDCHTTGKANMSLIEAIVFVADYTEETRKYQACQQERTILHNELESSADYKSGLSALTSSVLRILDYTVKYLYNKKEFIHPRTLDALEYYRTLKGEK